MTTKQWTTDKLFSSVFCLCKHFDYVAGLCLSWCSTSSLDWQRPNSRGLLSLDNFLCRWMHMTCPAHPSRTSNQTADQLVIRLSLSPSPMAMKDDWTSMKGSSLIKAVCPHIDLKERSMCWKRKNKSNFVNESSLRRSRNNAVWPLHTYMKHVCAFALKTSVKQLLPRQEFLGTSQQSSQTAVSQSGELRRSSE